MQLLQVVAAIVDVVCVAPQERIHELFCKQIVNAIALVPQVYGVQFPEIVDVTVPTVADAVEGCSRIPREKCLII